MQPLEGQTGKQGRPDERMGAHGPTPVGVKNPFLPGASSLPRIVQEAS